eukprot:TRINITY_DN20830_c0_g5_i1.p1 TRINITY_DN20830_c0_g5~~TRINITY_DN20830_c0_g5_i1.p1  ORF type:complete len:623 (+),score=77.06 TRINITY_DN20830_c0_g5_i1:67-1869(+)
MEGSTPKRDYERMGEAPQKPRLPILETEIKFSLMLLRQVFRKVEKLEHSKEVHVSVVRRYIRNMLDLHSFHLQLDVEQIGTTRNVELMTWKDLRASIDRGVIPTFHLSFPQMIHLALDTQNSVIGCLWYALTNLAIIINVSLLIALSMPEVRDFEYYELLRDVEHYCVYFFTLDYFAKAITACWCPIGMVDEYWLLQHVDASSTSVVQHSKFERFFHFVAAPPNIVDFASICPFLLQEIFENKLPLSSLRMLRLLRVFRVLKSFKALGKWVVELQVLGEAFYTSLGTVAVLLIYMILLAMLAGAIINNQDRHTDPSFGTVPWSMWYVVSRFVGMAHSLPTKGAIPLAPLSVFVLACVGLFKGVIFLLPIERLKTATKHAEAYYKELAEMSAEIEGETLQKTLPASSVWTDDVACPVVRIELFHYSEELKGPIGESCGLVKCPVPILYASPENTTLTVPVLGPAMRTFTGSHPVLEVNIQWKPAPGNHSAPCGTLTMQLVRGSSLRSTGGRLCCCFEVPVSLYGEGAGELWTCGPCDFPSTEPKWSTEHTKVFDVRWEAQAPKSKPESKQDVFHEHVLELLTSQAEQIKRLEAVVQRLSAK